MVLNVFCDLLFCDRFAIILNMVFCDFNWFSLISLHQKQRKYLRNWFSYKYFWGYAAWCPTTTSGNTTSTSPLTHPPPTTLDEHGYPSRWAFQMVGVILVRICDDFKWLIWFGYNLKQMFWVWFRYAMVLFRCDLLCFGRLLVWFHYDVGVVLIWFGCDLIMILFMVLVCYWYDLHECAWF